ncbi:thiol-disulfide oxidoreductase DCC family protein [bacterium AH-315-J21]|nr:thiol-disulfide oxidoreductase DCC family protein [bacterium AH-315-J21]
MMCNSKPILLFDGVCNLCNYFVQFTIKRDPNAKFRFAALQSSAGQALLKESDLSDDDLDSFVLIKDDKCFVKSSAALHVFKEIGGFWKVFYVLIIIPRPLRDVLYKIVAKMRYRVFGKRDTCMLPTPDIEKRFLK